MADLAVAIARRKLAFANDPAVHLRQEEAYDFFTTHFILKPAELALLP